MSSFCVIYKSEIKKIISKKAVWLAMAIGLILVLLMGFTNLSSEGHISYVSSSREILSQMDGMDIDEAFFLNFQNEVFEELKLNPAKYEKLMDYDPGAAFMNGAGAVGKKSVFDFIYNVVRERSMVETVTAEEFYEKMRDNIISDGQELGSNDEEINEWLKEYDSIEKPIKYYYAQSYANILDVWFFVGWVLFLNIAIALAGVFADEKTFRTDAILLSTKKRQNSFMCFKGFGRNYCCTDTGIDSCRRSVYSNVCILWKRRSTGDDSEYDSLFTMEYYNRSHDRLIRIACNCNNDYVCAYQHAGVLSDSFSCCDNGRPCGSPVRGIV